MSSHILDAERTMNVTLLLSGDQAERTADVQSGLVFRVVAFDPSAFMTTKENTKLSEFRSMNAMREPSGDHVGQESRNPALS
jgi:hypothetical protein